MKIKKLKFTKVTDQIHVGGMELISLQCVARTMTEAGAIRQMTKNTADSPVPFYREKIGSPIYFERRIVEAILIADAEVRAAGLRRSMDPRPGKNTRDYAHTLRLNLAAKNLWTPEQLDARSAPTRKGAKKLITNEPLPWPQEPTLFDEPLFEGHPGSLTVSRALDLDGPEVQGVLKNLQGNLEDLRTGKRIHRPIVIDTYAMAISLLTGVPVKVTTSVTQVADTSGMKH